MAVGEYDQVRATQGMDNFCWLHNHPLATQSPSQGKYADAEQLLERSQTIQEKVLGPEHSTVASVLCNRGLLLKKQVGIEPQFCCGSTFVGELFNFLDVHPCLISDQVLARQGKEKIY